MWLVWQARVKAQTWFDAVLVVVYDCGRQLLAVAESIGCLVGQLLYVYGGGIVKGGMGKLLPFYGLCAVLSPLWERAMLHYCL